MKKNLLLLGCIAMLVSCGGNSGSEYDKYYSSDGKKDTTAAANVNASARKTEVDTNLTNIGTDRAAGGGAVEDNYERGKMLIASSDCLGCHQEKQKLVGPAYEDVAKKYEFNDKNVNYLAHKIINGGKGVWGEIPMAPHPVMKEEDAKEMARYVLSLRK